MMRIAIFSLAGFVLFGCGDASNVYGVHVDDTPAAISEPGDSFRAYANLTLTDGESEERYSFYLDELESPMDSFWGCSGEAFAVCGSAEFAFCHEGVWFGANSNSPVGPANDCAGLPDKWEMDRRVNCPLDDDQMIAIERIRQHDQSHTTQPAPDYLGEPVVVPRAEGSNGGGDATDPAGPDSTEGTTQPGQSSDDSDSESGRSSGSSLSGTSSGARSGSSSTSQPGRL